MTTIMSLRTRITAAAAAVGLAAAALIAAGTPASATPAHPKKYAKNYWLDGVGTKWVVWTSAAPHGGVWAARDKADGKIHGYEQNEPTIRAPSRRCEPTTWATCNA